MDCKGNKLPVGAKLNYPVVLLYYKLLICFEILLFTLNSQLIGIKNVKLRMKSEILDHCQKTVQLFFQHFD